MEAKFLKIIVLAAISDGEFQASEKDLIDHLVKSHPIFKAWSEIASSAMVDIYNKTNAGMEPKYILDQLGPEFDQEKHCVCSSKRNLRLRFQYSTCRD